MPVASTAEMFRRYGWLLFLPAAGLLYAGGATLEHMAIVGGAATALTAVLLPRWRGLLTITCACLLAAACSSLALHLLNDDFHYHYVWLYSGAALPWYLKIANVWGGEEGTLLFMATLLALSAIRLQRYRGEWTGPGILLLTTAFALSAAIWQPFALTPAEDLLRQPSQGMNVHLTRIWMALHPPLIFGAYVFLLAPAGAAFEALLRGRGDWMIIADRYGRSGWLILSAGLAAGMWWAYEDFTFGQFWHWDPVQTSVFIVWALATAYLHGLRFYRPDGFLGRTLPALALLTGVAVLISMLVTRNAVLASSHRYIGDTSFPVLALLAGLLLVLTLAAWIYAATRKPRHRRRLSENTLLIYSAVILFGVIASAAVFQLAYAYIAAFLELPRPASLKPFFEILARWAQPHERTLLQQVFNRWDVDNFAVNAWLAPLGVLTGLFGGHAFLKLHSRRLRWSITATATAAALLIAYYLQPLDIWYNGSGMTSRHTVAIFFWLDALLAAAFYLIGSTLFWLLRMVRRHYKNPRVLYAYYLPVGLIHIGVMIALLGALSASVLDGYAQQTLNYPDDFGQPKWFPGDYQLRVDIQNERYLNDGARISPDSNHKGFQAVAQVQLVFGQQGDRTVTGNTVFRDQRPPLAGERGAVRQLCEMLDYRFARYRSGAGYRLDPFIRRGFWRDIQVWLPPPDYAVSADGSFEPQATSVTVVIKTYPLLSWLWLGLLLALTGGVLMTVFAWRPSALSTLK